MARDDLSYSNWVAKKNVPPYIWGQNTKSALATIVALRPQGATFYECTQACCESKKPYTLNYTMSAQYARSFYGEKGYSAIYSYEDVPVERLVLNGHDNARAPKDLIDHARKHGSVKVPVIRLVPNLLCPQPPGRGKPDEEQSRQTIAAQIRHYGSDQAPYREWARHLGVDFVEIEHLVYLDIPGKANTSNGPFAGNSVQHLRSLAETMEAAGGFVVTSDEDSRDKTQRSIVLRRGQPDFRNALMEAYGARCAITGCEVRDVLEAAHIYPYRGENTNHVQNGLLLRADIHTLFDLGKISIDPDRLTVILDPALMSSDYAKLHGKKINVPGNPRQWPSKEALKWRRDQMQQ